jgi:hypothetical protein
MTNRRTDVITSWLLIAATFIAIISVFKINSDNLLFPLLIAGWLSVWWTIWYLLPTSLSGRTIFTLILITLFWLGTWFLWATLAIW